MIREEEVVGRKDVARRAGSCHCHTYQAMQMRVKTQRTRLPTCAIINIYVMGDQALHARGERMHAALKQNGSSVKSEGIRNPHC